MLGSSDASARDAVRAHRQRRHAASCQPVPGSGGICDACFTQVSRCPLSLVAWEPLCVEARRLSEAPDELDLPDQRDEGRCPVDS